MMRIGISLLGARPTRTGVENVAFNLINQLGQMDSKDEYLVYANTKNLPWLSALPKNIRIVDVKLTSARALWVWEHVFFLTSERPKQLDLIHFPILGGVIGYKGRFVLTIHDLKHYHNRDLVKFRRHLLYRAWYKANIKKAARIIAVSEEVKRDIVKEFPQAPDRIRVIPNGVDQRFKPSASARPFRAKYQLPDRYVLFVGQTTSNKNLRFAIDAMRTAGDRYKLDHQFIIAGMPGEDDVRLKKYVNNKNLQKNVRFIGYIDDGDLPDLYTNAQLFLFPSIAEGFGIPPLEAMGCGIPVVAGRVSCMPEILGDAAIWVNPHSVESIAEGIGRALLDGDVRRIAIAKGLARVAQFSWAKMASETASLYREALIPSVHPTISSLQRSGT